MRVKSETHTLDGRGKALPEASVFQEVDPFLEQEPIELLKVGFWRVLEEKKPRVFSILLGIKDLLTVRKPGQDMTSFSYKILS